MAHKSISGVSCVKQHDAADLCAGAPAKEAGEVLGACSPPSLTDRCTGLDAQFCAAEFFTLGLTSGMCEARAVL